MPEILRAIQMPQLYVIYRSEQFTDMCTHPIVADLVSLQLASYHYDTAASSYK